MAPPIPDATFHGPNILMFSDPTIVIIELVLTLLAVAFCFLIYFKTKEVYELTKYEGIKYFRYAFLFFGISYILSFISSIAIFSRIIFGLVLPRDIFGPLFILPLGYLSTMAILYLIYSSIWKNFESRRTLIISHIVAIVLTIVTFMTRSHLILLYLQSILFILAIILRPYARKDKKKISQTRILYFLVLGVWLVNLLVLGRGRPIYPLIDISLLIASILAYIFIYYKISKWVK